MKFYGTVTTKPGMVIALRAGSVKSTMMGDLIKKPIHEKKSARKVGISAACATNRHWQCFNMLCTCMNCNHPKV